MKTITFDENEYQLVPKNPTESMMKKAAIVDALLPHDNITFEDHCRNFGTIYQGMLAEARRES